MNTRSGEELVAAKFDEDGGGRGDGPYWEEQLDYGKSDGLGRPAKDLLLMLQMCVLQGLGVLSDEKTKFQMLRPYQLSTIPWAGIVGQCGGLADAVAV